MGYDFLRKKEIAIGSDLKREYLKENLKEYLNEVRREFDDLGSGDYVEVAADVARGVSEGGYKKGILICRTGQGMSIVANKFDSVFAARCLSVEDARDSRRVNNSNVLCLCEADVKLVRDIVYTWLNTEFCSSPKYVVALAQIKGLEDAIRR